MLSLVAVFYLAIPAGAQTAPVPGTVSASDEGKGAGAAGGEFDALIDAAREKGMRVIVVEPAEESEVPASPTTRQVSAGRDFVAYVGTVAKELERLIFEIGQPDWPEPSSNPLKPLTNGTLTTLSLIGIWFLVRSRGLAFASRFGAEPSTDRPTRVLAALAGIMVTSALSFLPAFAIYGTGSKTIELVGWQLDLFLTVVLLGLAAAAILERVHDRSPDLRDVVEPSAIAFNVNAVLGVLFVLITMIEVLSFMYPEPSMDELALLVSVAFAAAMLIWLTRRHRRAIAVLTANVVRRAPPRVCDAAWLGVLAYVLLSTLVAFGRVLLDHPRAISVVIAPGTAVLVGAFFYYLALFVIGQVLGAPGKGIDAEDVDAAVIAPRRSFARALGGGIGILYFLDRVGFEVLGEDGELSFPALTALVIIIAYGAWVWTSTAIDRRLALETAGNGPAEQSGEGEGGVGLSRLATLLPLFRNVAFFAIFFIAGVILMYEAGVNITPLFASAGIIGLAIGFGAQSLVRDIISGVFFLIDDAFRMGEYIETGGLKGTVERISIRSMQLRHHNGPLNTIPFGAINDLTNYSRDWVIMKLPIKVTLDTDPERVRKLVKNLGVELLEDPMVGAKFIEPLKSQGVLAIDNWGMTIRVKFKTRPGDQFVTRRVVYAKLHEMFEREGIIFASRDVRIQVAGAPDGGSAPAPATTPGGGPAATGTASAGAAGATVLTAAALAMDDEMRGPDEPTDER